MESNKKYLIIFTISFVLFIGFAFKVVPQIYKNISKINKIKNDKIELTKQIESLDKKIEHLDSLDIEFEKEKIARNNIKMIKPGEYIYKLEIKKNK